MEPKREDVEEGEEWRQGESARMASFFTWDWDREPVHENSPRLRHRVLSIRVRLEGMTIARMHCPIQRIEPAEESRR